MKPWRGKWALVTGASSGIGLELAKQLAADGANLVITARRVDRLTQIAHEIHDGYGTQVEVCPADLRQPQAPAELFRFAQEKHLPIDVLVNNAGFGTWGEFSKTDRQSLLDQIQVNIAAVVDLSRLFAPAMIERGDGYILIVASTAAFQPVGYLSTYSASKGFEMLFAGAISEELRPLGVHVTCLCPGSTLTEWQAVAGLPAPRPGRHSEPPHKPARAGLTALAKGKPLVISGLGNLMAMEAQRLAPRQIVARAATRMYRPTT